MDFRFISKLAWYWILGDIQSSISEDYASENFRCRPPTAELPHMSPLNLLFVVEDSGDDYVLEGLGWIEAEPLGDGLYSLRPKVSLRVHVHNLYGGGQT